MPNITLDLRELLEALWRTRPNVLVSVKFAEILKSYDKDEIFCHLHYHIGSVETGGPFYVLWRLPDWRTEYEKYIKDKEEMDIRIAAHNIKKEMLDLMITALRQSIGLDDSMLETMARKLYNTKNIEAIKHLTGLEYKLEDFT